MFFLAVRFGWVLLCVRFGFVSFGLTVGWVKDSSEVDDGDSLDVGPIV